MSVNLRASMARATRSRSSVSEVAALYRQHFGYVWQVLRKLGVEPPALEDAAHDVFLVVHRRWRDFEGRAATRTWLFAIARRVASRHRRSDRRRQRRHAALARAQPPEASAPDTVLAGKEAWRRLLAFLDGLDVEHREAFLLGELEGLSRTQMGRVLGISPNTAYSRLRAARKRFTATFTDRDERRAVYTASVPQPRAAERRVWALVVTGAGAGRPLALSIGIGKAATVLCATGGVALGIVAAAGWSVPDPRPSPRAPAASTAARAEPVDTPQQELEREPPMPAGSDTASPATGHPRVATPRARQVATATPRRRTTRQPTTTAATPDSPPPPSDPAFPDLSPAMASLAQARRALEEGRPIAALQHLEHAGDLDRVGVFSTERAVTRLWALCAAHEPERARAEARRFLQHGSTAAYAAVLSDSCVADVIDEAASGDEER